MSAIKNLFLACSATALFVSCSQKQVSLRDAQGKEFVTYDERSLKCQCETSGEWDNDGFAELADTSGQYHHVPCKKGMMP